jgi:hypothetical protein
MGGVSVSAAANNDGSGDSLLVGLAGWVVAAGVLEAVVALVVVAACGWQATLMQASASRVAYFIIALYACGL